MNKHVNNGNCEKCDDLFALFPGFHPGLQQWFKAFQKKNSDGHISCAGRGSVDQEAAFTAGTSKAHWGQSSHNYNLALDIFRLTLNGASWDRPWFRDRVGTAVFSHNATPDKQFTIDWYGKPGAKFPELPHCEVENWKGLQWKLVE